MKTKMTKLSVLAFLGLGLVVYGQSGKVGVNISSPRATLDVQPNAINSEDDAKTNEGILAPKLSKTRVASIEAPVEGTLVYVIDDANKTNGTINAYKGTDPKVAKITEKGYYYYNGTEWVKSAAGSLDQEWVYNSSTKNIELKRSGTSPFDNKVYFDEKGGYKNITENLRGVELYHKDLFNTKNINLNFSENISSSYVDPIFKGVKYLSTNTLFIDNKEDSYQNIANYSASRNLVGVLGESQKDYVLITSTSNGVSYSGKGTIKYAIIGATNDAGSTQESGTIASIIGSRNTAYTTSSLVSYLDGSRNQVAFRGNGTVNFAHASRNLVELDNRSQGTIKNLTLSRNELSAKSDFTGTIENLDGISIYFNVPSGINTLSDSMHGLRIGHVTRGRKNYAIRTGRGISSFGDNLEIRRDYFSNENQQVVLSFMNMAEEKKIATSRIIDQMEGGGYGGSHLIFETQEASDSSSGYPNKKESTEKMRITSKGNIGIGIQTPIEKLEVAGNVKATGFIGANAAIFPDYVFQKYYTGTSSLKADYNFKTLSQVEDFVKTNGYLPGYKSAAEIKKQGYIDLMATQLTNVEKIEELYLHSIEQEKKIEAQQKQIEELKSLVQELLKK
ncbi:hypothetical protein D1000_03675 [Riemerella anatipestifer]|uniref:hypothetical protein n=1 Tax=Riemerella anatipestifer TaxID=34085 RepID=UPI00129E4935|nr:hypothetical protein [Riemerella anatipestifer]MRN15941.1 hypothetical protein [Riemerella anatipestifer]